MAQNGIEIPHVWVFMNLNNLIVEKPLVALGTSDPGNTHTQKKTFMYMIWLGFCGISKEEC